jgi:hypothetical protein
MPWYGAAQDEKHIPAALTPYFKSCRMDKYASHSAATEKVVLCPATRIQTLWLASNACSFVFGVITASTRGWEQLQVTLALLLWSTLTWAAFEFSMACVVRQTMSAYTRGTHLLVCTIAVYCLGTRMWDSIFLGPKKTWHAFVAFIGFTCCTLSQNLALAPLTFILLYCMNPLHVQLDHGIPM